MGINIAMSVFIGMVFLLFYATYKVKKQRQKDFDDLVEREVKEREENPDLFVKDNDQVWIEYMGMRLPFFKFELPRWKALSTDEKKAWVKQLKDDLKTGKKVAIREKGKVVAYKVKDRKTIRNEDMREELYKKVNNL